MTFTGDQLGALFAGRILAQYKASGKPLGRAWPPSLACGAKCVFFWPRNDAEKLCMVASTVSSKMIEAMAATEGFKFTECLTGS